MSLGDIFRRKSLLPAGKLAKLSSTVPPAKDSSKAPAPAQRLSVEGATINLSPSGQEVFERPTVVPQLPADEHARSLMNQLDEHEPAAGNAPRSRSDEVMLSSAALELDLSEGSALGFLERQQSQAPPRAHKPQTPAVASEAPQQSQVSAADLYAVGDFSGALALAEQRLQEAPEDELAQNYRQRCQEVLTKMWTARLGSLDKALRVAVPPDQIRWLSVDHRAGFVLSLLDGHSTIDEVLDICGMPRLQALRILAELLNRGAIEVVR